jgi:hypothetical protein
VAKVSAFYCDAPGCEVLRLPDETNRPEGISGTAVEYNPEGYLSNRIEWFACSREHVAAAITTSLEWAQSQLDV